MGMLLRRKGRKPEVEPKVNGKPVVKEPKQKQKNLTKNLIMLRATVVNPTVTKF